MEGLDVKLTTCTDFVQNTDNVNLTIKFIFHQSTHGILYDTNFVEVIVPKIRQLVAETLDEFDALHTLQQLRSVQNTTNPPTPTTPPPATPSPTTPSPTSLEERLGQLRRVSFPHHFQDIPCGLCHAPFIQNEFYRTATICKHTFHKRCIDRWVSSHELTCPVCQNVFLSPIRPE